MDEAELRAKTQKGLEGATRELTKELAKVLKRPLDEGEVNLVRAHCNLTLQFWELFLAKALKEGAVKVVFPVNGKAKHEANEN